MNCAHNETISAGGEGHTIISQETKKMSRAKITKLFSMLFVIFMVLTPMFHHLHAAADKNCEQSSELLAKKPDIQKPEVPFKQPSEPAPGKFLIAGHQMGDTRFRKAVILLISYNWEGAMGIIINRPTKMRITEAFPDLKGFAEKEDMIFWGGPVEMNRAFMLIRSKKAPQDTVQILDNVHFGTSRALLEHISNSDEMSESSRVYLGYAGWARGQLDREILRGGWRVMNGDAESVFSKRPEDIWNRFILLDPGQQVMSR